MSTSQLAQQQAPPHYPHAMFYKTRFFFISPFYTISFNVQMNTANADLDKHVIRLQCLCQAKHERWNYFNSPPDLA